MANVKKKIELPKPGQLVRVINRGGRDGYRRGGIRHPKGQKDYAHDAFDADKFAALTSDPKLDVRVIDAPRDAEKPAS